MFPNAGEKLGPYEILGELGGGGMARVYRARDGRLHREVAIKVIGERFAMPGTGERFLREARAAAGLNHPNICTIFDMGERDGAPYLVMELLEGEPLSQRITRGAISVEEILRHSAEVADALAAAHARGIVHRGIKPANIFLVKRPNGSAQAKVLDFGLAKMERIEMLGEQARAEREFASQLSGIGATLGTVSYMSPEQVRGEQLDARSDLFSLGVVMYEMAAGQLPFRGNTSALVFVQLLGQMSPEPVRRLNGGVPAELEQIIMKLLTKSPRARFQSATELTDELQELAEQESGWLARMKTRMFEASASTDLSAKPGRTSIATKPRRSFPAAAPYTGRSGLRRAHGVARESAGYSGKDGETGAGPAHGLSGLRPAVRAVAVPEPVLEEDHSAAAEAGSVVWWWAALAIALTVALIVLLAGVVASKFGWMRASA